MDYNPWLPPLESDRRFFDAFRRVGHAFHDGSLTADALANWRAERLGIVLSHVTASSPFYRRHFEGIDLGQVTPSDLTRLPFTTKDDLRTHMLDIVSGDIRRAMYYYQTTGTTGPATPCPRDTRESLASNFNAAMSIRKILTRLCGESARPALAVLAPNELHAACKTYADIGKDLGMMVLDAWPSSPAVGWRTAAEVLSRLKIDAAIGPPALFATLAKAAAHYGLDPKADFGLKAILCLGEVCSEPMKRNLASIWNCEVHDFVYGSQEAFIMAAADVDGHLVPSLPNYVWEVIDPDTGRSQPSGFGELCVTCLADGVKPLIRYRTGDLVDLSFDAAHPAAATSSLRVHGRSRDKVRIGLGDFSALELEQLALDGLTGCVGYQYELLAEGDTESVLLRVEMLKGVTPPPADRLASRLAERLSVPVRVELVAELDVRAGTGSWVSWKAARVLDRRAQPPGPSVDEANAAIAFTRAMRGR